MDLRDYFKEPNLDDPIERVFGIVIYGGLIVVVVYQFIELLGPLGATWKNLATLVVLGIGGTYLGLAVLRWFRKRDSG